ncbi:MAG: GtrA family protein [Patescibacteria group bacterium]
MEIRFKKHDIIYTLILGEVTAWLAFFIIKNLELVSFPFLWLVLASGTPLTAIICLYLTFLIGKKIPVIFQAGKFAVIGISNTLIDWGVLNILIFFTGVVGGVFYSIFKGLSFVVATSNSFIWNKFWTFNKKDSNNTGKELSQFLIVSLIGLGINILVASLIVNLVQPVGGASPKIWATLGAVIASASSMAWNFLGYKFLVFKKKTPKTL